MENKLKAETRNNIKTLYFDANHFCRDLSINPTNDDYTSALKELWELLYFTNRVKYNDYLNLLSHLIKSGDILAMVLANKTKFNQMVEDLFNF